jgi:hypothetical protein
MTHQSDIREVSVARNGLIKIAYNAEQVNVGCAKKRMEKLGVKDFTVTLDWYYGRVLVEIKNDK